MTTEMQDATDEGLIRKLIDNWAQALRAKNIEGLMADYAPGFVAFDLAPPLQVRGTDAHRKGFEEWLPTSTARSATRHANSASQSAAMWPSAMG